MKDYLTINKTWWNNITPVHLGSKLYNLPIFKKGKSSLISIERKEIGDVKGKTILHLMCHFGMDTLSWAREGAIVTGVDFSEKAIENANELSREIKTPARFICSDVYKLPEVLNEKFDIIFASYGVLCWLPNLRKWVKIINQFLKDGGFFYIVELHPFTNILSFDFKIAYKYFDKTPYFDDSSGTYADWNADIKGLTYGWTHTIGEVINVLIEEGLKIEYVHEFPFTMYEQFPGLMEEDSEGHYVFKNKRIQVPLLFSLKATKQP